MPHASTEPRKVTGFWILSCCHSQEVMLLLVNVVSKGGGGVAEMALHTFLNALSVSSRVSCGFQHCVSPAAESVL